MPVYASGWQVSPLSTQAPEQMEPDSLVWIDLSLFNARLFPSPREAYAASICRVEAMAEISELRSWVGLEATERVHVPRQARHAAGRQEGHMNSQTS